MNQHKISIRVYYEDTDAGGIVYYANYLRFAERGRTEMLRAVGVHNSDLRAECGILIVVKAVEIDYKRPAVLDDSLILTTGILEIGKSSMLLSQNLTRDDVQICDMRVTLVCVAADTLRPVRWPDTFLNKITS